MVGPFTSERRMDLRSTREESKLWHLKSLLSRTHPEEPKGKTK